MFKWFTKVDADLDAAVDNIDKKIDELIEERDIARNEAARLTEQVKKIYESLADEDMVIDFKAINVFSVERNSREDIPCTIIGFLIKEGDTYRTHEWYLYCTQRVHTNIVKDFEEFKKNRDLTMSKFATL